MTKSIRNIALFAHVDAGKTSVTEQLLFHAKAIRTLGSVAAGNTQTDTLEIEKQRGITVNSSVLSFDWKDTQINLIDTPGHIDFSSEAARAFMAIDAAVVIISAVEGVQAQTENLINQLKIAQKPFIIFINKTDRIGTDIDTILQELETDLKLTPFVLQHLQNEGTEEVTLTNCWDAANYINHKNRIEQLVENDEALFEQYLLDEVISFETLETVLIKLTHKQQVTPIFLGSSKYALGIERLLEGIVNYLPQAQTLETDLSAIVFKTIHQKDGKWLAVRVLSGMIRSRDIIHNTTQNCDEKATAIKSIAVSKTAIVEQVTAGEIALIKGFSKAKPGDFLGKLPANITENTLAQPLLSVQVIPKDKAATNKLVEALTIFNNEDPALDFEYIQEENEFHIKIHGTIQQEILANELASRFDLEVYFSEPTVIYKETPTVAAEGYVRYWMPKPCWAIMRFKIMPLSTGSGVQFNSEVSTNAIKKQYQKDVEKALPLALKQGVLGWEVTDVAITLIEGEDHVMHTKSNDFYIATPMGIHDGLTQAKMTLLEPIMIFKLKASNEFLGKITSELIRLRATIQTSETVEDTIVLTGEIPLATAVDFPIKLSAITSGKAKLNMRFSKYEKCPIDLGKTRDYKGISPLDTAKYILKARKALV